MGTNDYERRTNNESDKTFLVSQEDAVPPVFAKVLQSKRTTQHRTSLKTSTEVIEDGWHLTQCLL